MKLILTPVLHSVWLYVLNILLLLIVLLFFWTGKGFSQCNPPEQLPTPTCDMAPLICLQNACYETLGIPNGGPSGWCNGNNTIENPQFFSFIPTSSSVEIQIHVDFCESGTSLQAAIISECPWGVEDVLSCNGGTPPGGTIYLSAAGLVIGQPYLLMFDGSSGALCNYTITYTSGIYSPGFDEELSTGAALPASVCVGYNDLELVAGPPIGLAHGYFWVLEWSGDTVYSTLPTTSVEVPGDLDPGTYEICVWAFSGCDTTDNELCFEVEVYKIDPEERDPVILCPEEFPLSWGNLAINGPGEYARTFNTPEGCTYDSLWVVEAYPEPDMGIVDTFHCLPTGEVTFYYENEAYDNPGTYDLFYPNGDINGCDSMAELHLLMIGIDAFTELSCDEGDFVLTNYVQEVIPFNADIEYYWYEQGGNVPIAEGNPFHTTLPGCYDLYINVITPEGFCEFFNEVICFDGDDLYPPAPELPHMDTLICAQEGVMFCVTPDPFGEQNLEYVWSAPGNVPVFQDGSECVEMDFSNSSGGQVCVYASGECGSGSSTCFEVEIIQSPVITFNHDPSVCVNEVTTITFTGTATPNAQFIWDFNTPSTITGSGPGPYQLSWASPGSKNVTLSVIEAGCDTASGSVNVNVEILPSPVINCASTINSISFDWEDIPGAIGYLASINGTPAVNVTGSDTTLTMLTPGTNAELILTVVTTGPCPATADTMVCTAQDCPPPLIELMGDDSVCLNNPSIVDLEAIVNGMPGTGTWDGPGITDMNEGYFDPRIAGPGQHQLTYAVVLNDCPFSQPYTITVFDSLTADFIVDPFICITENAGVQYSGNASANAIYHYDFGTAVIEAGSGAGPYQVSWNTQGEKTINLQVEENGCLSEVISQTANIIAELTAPVVPCSSNTNGVVFSWTIDPAATDYEVNVLSGHTGALSDTAYSFGGLSSGDIVEIEIITKTNGPCPERRDTFECEARACPPVELAITPVSNLCLYNEVDDLTLEVTVNNGNGVGDWSGPGITDNVNGIFSPVTAGTGSHLITYHYLDDGCDFFETVTINVNQPPTAVISNTDLVITCSTGSIFLDGASSSGTALLYEWSTVNGSFTGSTNMNIAEAARPGFYQLLVTDAMSGCKDSVAVMVTQDSNIPVADAGPDRVLTCDSTVFILGGASGTGTDIIYQWTTVNGNIIGEHDNIISHANEAGDYVLIVRDTVTGCQSQDHVMITSDTTVAVISLVAGDTIDCNTVFSTVSAFLNEPSDDYLFAWTTSDGNIPGASDVQDIEVSQGGTYQLVIHNTRNGCESSSQVFVAESDEIIDAVIVDQVNVSCFGNDDGSLSVVEVEGGQPEYTYTWSVGIGSTPDLISLPPGDYSLTVSDVNGCSNEQSFTIVEPDLLTIDIGANQTVTEGDSVSIRMFSNLSGAGIGSIAWSEYQGTTCPGCTTFDFVAISSATISATITDTAGCEASDSMRLTVIVPRLIYVPNIFSPNDDGTNDYFTISGKSNLLSIASLQIFDRWGNQLFEKKNLAPGDQREGWDGTFRSEPLPPGVYVFVAELIYEGLTEFVTGSITLVR
jgi:gliding motility-associated-like protein